nr:sigma-70 factor domain-containing protein [Candidatus Gracilibacteria bacterium]
MPSEQVLNRFPTEVKILLEKGRQQQFITQKELIKAFPNCEDDLDLFEEILSIFDNLGIKIIDSNEVFVPEKNALNKSEKKANPEPVHWEEDEEEERDHDGFFLEEDLEESDSNLPDLDNFNDDNFVPSDEEIMALEAEKNNSDNDDGLDIPENHVDLTEISNDSVRMYLAEIGKVHLLTPEEEIKLARDIR